MRRIWYQPEVWHGIIYVSFFIVYWIYFTEELMKQKTASPPSVSPTPTKIICLMPSIEVTDQLLGYVNYTVPELHCKNGIPPYVRQRSNKISKILFKYLNTTHLDCCYSELIATSKGKITVKSNCKRFDKQANIASKYIKVLCNYKGQSVYEDYFIFPDKNPKVRKKNILKRYNVLILGFRSVSVINAYRKLSKLLNYLRYDMGVIEYSKYNAVSLNWIDNETLQNIIPLYTGMTYVDTLKVYNQKNYEKLNFIWERYKQEGYKILLAEDCVRRGVFQKGILKNATANYSFLPFMELYERHTGHVSNGDCYICTSSKRSYKVVLDHYTSWSGVVRENREKHFAMLWINSLTAAHEAHKGLNVLEIAAQDLIEFFKTLKVRGFLEDTIVFIVSDHGYMNNDLYSIEQFKTEMKLPLLRVLPPEQLKARKLKIVNQLITNRDKLVTPFDVHRTLETILKFNTNTFTYNQPKQRNMTRGISLFDKVPHRRCESIGVTSRSCACKYIAKYVPKPWKPPKQ